MESRAEVMQRRVRVLALVFLEGHDRRVLGRFRLAPRLDVFPGIHLVVAQQLGVEHS